MKIFTSAITLFRHFGAETAMDILSDAGFEAIDIYIPQVFENCKQVRQLAEDRGLEIYQTHAAFPLEVWDAIKSVYISADLGCSNLVFHPVLHPDFDNRQNWEKAKSITRRKGMSRAVSALPHHSGSNQIIPSKIRHLETKVPEIIFS